MTEQKGEYPHQQPETTRHEFRVQSRAARLGIEGESMQHPLVRRFLEAGTAAESLTEDIISTQSLLGRGSPHSGEFGQATVIDRYLCAESLMEGVADLLEAGVSQDSWPLSADMVRSDLSTAAKYYGLELLPVPARHAPDEQLEAQPQGVWRSRHRPAVPVPSGVPVSEATRWYHADPPEQRTDSAHEARLAVEAQRFGFPPGMVDADPTMRRYLTNLIDAKALVAAAEESVVLPPAPGLEPSARERLIEVAALGRLVVGVLEDQQWPGTLTVQRFAAELAVATRSYGLQPTPGGPGLLGGMSQGPAPR